MAKYQSNFIKRMLSAKKDIYDRRDKTLASVYLSVEKYVKEGKGYTTLKVAKEFVDCWLKGTKDDDLALVFHISTDRVRGIKKQLSDDLYRVFGLDFFDLLSDYVTPSSKEEVNKRIYSALHVTETSTEYLSGDLIGSIRSKMLVSSESYTLKDCEAEIRFLKHYSKKSIKEAMEVLDAGKLVFLLDILDKKVNNSDLRTELVKEFDTK